MQRISAGKCMPIKEAQDASCASLIAFVRAMLVVEDGTRITPPFPMRKAKRRRLRRKKGRQPRLAALGSPFQGKGLVWTLPPSYGRRCPEGAEVGWGKRYEKERGGSSQVDDSRKHPLQKQLIKPIYSYKKRKSNAANDFNVIYRLGCR